MTIATKTQLATAYMRQAELNPLDDTADLLDAVAQLYHCSPDDVADAVESERQALQEAA